MNAKILRVEKEIDKTKEKISEHQARLRELEKQKTELENLDIVSAVRGMNIPLADLAVLLKNVRPDASATSGQVGPKSKKGAEAIPAAHEQHEEITTITHEQEENE